MTAESFRGDLSSLLNEAEMQEIRQVEQLMELAGAAQNERDLERYERMEIDLESLEEANTQLHGFLRGAVELMRAEVGAGTQPFRDEYLLRLFMSLREANQREIVTSSGRRIQASP